MTPKHIREWAKLFLTFVIVFGFFGVTIGIMNSKKDNVDHDILSFMAGTLGTTFANIIYSYFRKRDDS